MLKKAKDFPRTDATLADVKMDSQRSAPRCSALVDANLAASIGWTRAIHASARMCAP